MSKANYTAIRYSIEKNQLEIVAKNKYGDLFMIETGSISLDIDEAANIDEDFVDDVVFFSGRQSTNRFNISWVPYDADCFIDTNWIEVQYQDQVVKTLSRGKRIIEKTKQILNERAA